MALTKEIRAADIRMIIVVSDRAFDKSEKNDSMGLGKLIILIFYQVQRMFYI